MKITLQINVHPNLLSLPIVAFVAPLMRLQVVLFSKIILHHSTIQAIYKTNLHMWFDQAHLWVL
jgi:hypothetical protein